MNPPDASRRVQLKRTPLWFPPRGVPEVFRPSKRKERAMLTCKRCGVADKRVRDFDTGSACHPELCQCIEALRSIVSRLPRTADGVPVVPGMEFYALCNYSRIWKCIALRFSEDGKLDTVVGWVPLSQCYAKLENAEAARAAGASDDR